MVNSNPCARSKGRPRGLWETALGSGWYQSLQLCIYNTDDLKMVE